MPKILKSHVLLIALIAVVIATNIVWVVLDESPALWDIAGHSYRSALYGEMIKGFNLKTMITFPTIYPPLPYLITGMLFVIFGAYNKIPQLSLLLWLILYCISIYGIALHFLKHKKYAVFAIALSLLYPLTSHFTRIYDLDFPLVAMTTASIAALLKTDNLQNRKWSIIFAVVTAGAFLTKWTALIFLITPILYILIPALKKERRKNSLKNILPILIIIPILVLPWYMVHGKDILVSANLTRHNVFSVPHEDLWSWDNAYFYIEKTIQAISWPLALLFPIGLFFAFAKKLKDKWFLILWIVMPYLLMTFVLYSKESRYFMPVFPAIAILSASFLMAKKRFLKTALITLVIIIGGFIWTETSWGTRLLNNTAYNKLAFTSRVYGYQNISYKAPGFGFTAPTNYHTNIVELTAPINVSWEPLKIAVVPNSMYLSGQEIQYLLCLKDMCQLETLADFSLSTTIREKKNWPEYLSQADYIITKTGDQGPLIWGKHLPEVAAAEADFWAGNTENNPFAEFELLHEIKLKGIEATPQVGRVYQKKIDF